MKADKNGIGLEAAKMLGNKNIEGVYAYFRPNLNTPFKKKFTKLAKGEMAKIESSQRGQVLHFSCKPKIYPACAWDEILWKHRDWFNDECEYEEICYDIFMELRKGNYEEAEQIFMQECRFIK